MNDRFKKNFLVGFGLFLIIFFLFLFLNNFVLAVSEEECRRQQEENTDKGVICWETLLGEVGQKKATLKSEIAKFNTKIFLTTAQIVQTATQIKTLEEEITSLTVKIFQLDKSLDELSGILVKRIAETYKKSSLDPLALFLSSEGFNEFVSRFKYLRVIQHHDRKLLLQMETARTNYDDQKTLKEEKQTQLEAAQQKLESQKVLLAQQKADRENLLKITQNDEKRFQSLLAAARAEQEAMLSVMRHALALLKDGTPIGQGSEIALMGNTGYPCCSTGTHLHFEIRKDGAAHDPASYLKAREVTWNNEPDGPFGFSGDWEWPMENPRITQGFGMTHYARIGYYAGGPHTGVDIVGSPVVIRAPKPGTLYHGSTVCGSGCGINYVAVDHGDGLISWYWHCQ
jgi:septal ring factor EnvC (AmiA/AmiB activator)